MNRALLLAVSAALLVLSSACALPPQSADQGSSAKKQNASIASVVGQAQRRTGLFPVWVDERRARVWIELDKAAPGEPLAECLLVVGLRQGLGSNPVGLDRGQLGGAQLVRFQRRGARVFLEQPNLGFRADEAEEAERRATAESFASSVLWSAPVAAEQGGRVLIELTSLLLQDRHGIANTLERSGQGGGWKVDAERSTLLSEQVLAFPDNLEFEAQLTLRGSKPGREVRSVTPDPAAVSLVQHHSLVRLPDDGYRPRRHDPRMGANSVQWSNYASDLQAPLRERRVTRHRLGRASAGQQPLVYYVDRGAPEPIRSALLDGARWWAEAFEAAGFPDSYRVELLPEGAHPLDVRYNVIQWVHRSTRGWSYGNSIVDPRTGEILKGHVSLGSLRVRQDRMLFEGLVGAEASGQGGAQDPVQLALARIRQLSAHEVGHTLGLQHNFAASTYAGRASVMDYPAPLVRLDGSGELDLSAVYGVGLGAWDVHAIRMLYGGDGDEAAYLPPLLARVGRHELLFATDADARPAGAAHPAAALWDNGADAPAALLELLEVRALGLRRFGLHCLPQGWPVGSLQEVFVPLYLMHRFQAEATAKWLGGVNYDPAARDAADPTQRSVPAADQERALGALLATLEPAALDISEETLALLLPRAPGGLGNGERFEGRTAPTFDALEAAATAADITLAALFQPERCARLVDQQRRDPSLPGFEGMAGSVLAKVFGPEPPDDPRLLAIQQVLQDTTIDRLIALASNPAAPRRVRERAEATLSGFVVLGPEQGSRDLLWRRVQRFLEREYQPVPAPAPAAEAPPGSPIGMEIGCGCAPGA